jgi:hypothetical protein
MSQNIKLEHQVMISVTGKPVDVFDELPSESIDAHRHDVSVHHAALGVDDRLSNDGWRDHFSL